MPQPLRYYFYDQVIEVPSPDTELEIQYLVDQTRDVEDNEEGINYSQILEAFGKQAIGGGNFVGITVVLLENWVIRFEARAGPTTEVMTIFGGNLVKPGGITPIGPSAYTTVTLAQSSSPTLTTNTSQENILYLVESLLSKQRQAGSYIYWDPYKGSDLSDGSTATAAVQSFNVAHAAATAGNFDTIIALSTDPAGEVTVTDPITISKAGLKVRGPGHAFKISPATTGSTAVNITGDNVEFTGFYISTPSGGADDGINVSGDNVQISDVWVNSTDGDGIEINGASMTKITESVIEKAGQSGAGNGINIVGGATRSAINTNIIFDNINGVSLADSGTSDNILTNNLIYKHTGYGVEIGSGVLRTGVRSGHSFNSNDLGNYLDSGSSTFIDTQAGGASASEIADAVWDEIITDHQVAGTTGKALRDAKTRATLASLQ